MSLRAVTFRKSGFLPLLGLSGGHALDGLRGIGRLGSAILIQEELSALSLIQGFLIALGIAEFTENLLLNQLRSIGIILDIANDFLHNLCFLSK